MNGWATAASAPWAERPRRRAARPGRTWSPCALPRGQATASRPRSWSHPPQRRCRKPRASKVRNRRKPAVRVQPASLASSASGAGPIRTRASSRSSARSTAAMLYRPLSLPELSGAKPAASGAANGATGPGPSLGRSLAIAMLMPSSSTKLIHAVTGRAFNRVIPSSTRAVVLQVTGGAKNSSAGCCQPALLVVAAALR